MIVRIRATSSFLLLIELKAWLSNFVSYSWSDWRTLQALTKSQNTICVKLRYYPFTKHTSCLLVCTTTSAVQTNKDHQRHSLFSNMHLVVKIYEVYFPLSFKKTQQISALSASFSIPVFISSFFHMLILTLCNLCVDKQLQVQTVHFTLQIVSKGFLLY